MSARFSAIVFVVLMLSTFPASATTELPGRWALVIGNAEYESSSIADLRAPIADSTLIRGALTSCGLFPQEQITLLSNVSFVEIISAFHNLELQLALQRREKPDLEQLVVFFYSGHGYAMGEKGAIVPSDTEVNLMAATTIDDVLLGVLLDRLQPARVVVILDCGQMGAEGLASSGRLVLAASGMSQCAYEDQDLGHGVFTYYLVDALRSDDGDGAVTFQEAFAHSKEMVKSYTRDRYGREVSPEMADGIGAFIVWASNTSACQVISTEPAGEEAQANSK